MPRHDTTALTGTIQHVFTHRFTLEAEGTIYLADLTPKGVEAFPLRQGLAVSLEGERRPSEIKVTRISVEGGTPVLIEHNKPHHTSGHVRSDVQADPTRALVALKEAGWSSKDEPRQKPKHFEVLARQSGGAWTELHIDFAGVIYRQKPADLTKWGLAAT